MYIDDALRHFRNAQNTQDRGIQELAKGMEDLSHAIRILLSKLDNIERAVEDVSAEHK